MVMVSLRGLARTHLGKARRVWLSAIPFVRPRRGRALARTAGVYRRGRNGARRGGAASPRRANVTGGV